MITPRNPWDELSEKIKKLESEIAALEADNKILEAQASEMYQYFEHEGSVIKDTNWERCIMEHDDCTKCKMIVLQKSRVKK